MIINYYYKQHITHQQDKSGMCIYIYIYIYISTKCKSEYIASSNKKKKFEKGLNIYLQIKEEEKL